MSHAPGPARPAEAGGRPASGAGAARAELDALELPSMTPAALARHFGPGMILMMTGVGTSHVVTLPVAGGRFEYALLWCIPVAYLFKYYGFETAFRFTHATGRSLLDAYGTAWRKLPLWYVLVVTIVQSWVGQAGRLVACGAVLHYFMSAYLGVDLVWLDREQELAAYAFAVGVFAVGVILWGRYAAVESVAKAGALVLVACAVGVYMVAPAPATSFVHFFRLDAPEGSWLIVAALLGLLPTGVDVSLQASEWGKAKRAGLASVRPALEAEGLAPRFDPFTSRKQDLAVSQARLPVHVLEYGRRWFVIALWDFRVGQIVSFVLACIFLLLAAVWLYPSEVEGLGVMGDIARIFTDSVGPDMVIVFLAGAFTATFCNTFNYFDGWPRVVAACCRNLFRPTASLAGIGGAELDAARKRTWYSEYNVYRATMLASLAVSVVLVAGLPRPVFLVLTASALAYFIAPVIYFLNLYYCFTVIPRSDRVLHPSRFAAVLGCVSLAVFSGFSALLIVQLLSAL